LDIRVIAATTVSSSRASAEKSLRESLFMFLNVFPITCLPLRERPEDVPGLAVHLLKITCKQLNRPVPTITERVMHQFQNYAWPGNVREMRNVIERAVIVSKGKKLQVEPLGGVTDANPNTDYVRTDAELQSMVRTNLIAALKATQGKVSGPTGAAALLEMRPTTVFSRIKTFGISNADWE